MQEKLDIAISRWVKSKTETNIINRIIDLAIAFEVLYLSDFSELAFKFRLRVAWHLGSDAQDRQKLMKLFNSIYKARSKAVHEGKFSAEEETLAEADKWFTRAVMKFIDDGNFPDWDSLVVGGTGTRNSKGK